MAEQVILTAEKSTDGVVIGLKVDPTTGGLLIKVEGSALPTGAATEATLATRATEATLAAAKTNLDTLVARTATLGQKAMAGSVPVALASDQTLPLPSGAATEATQAAAKSNLDTLVARTPATGQAAMAGSRPVVIASDQSDVPVQVRKTWQQYSTAGTKVGAAGVAVGATARRVRDVRVLNTGAGTLYLMVFDKATAPVAGDAPIDRVPVAAGASVSADFGLDGLQVAAGLGLAVSTTADTLTLPGASDAHLFARWATT